MQISCARCKKSYQAVKAANAKPDSLVRCPKCGHRMPWSEEAPVAPKPPEPIIQEIFEVVEEAVREVVNEVVELAEPPVKPQRRSILAAAKPEPTPAPEPAPAPPEPSPATTTWDDEATPISPLPRRAKSPVWISEEISKDSMDAPEESRTERISIAHTEKTVEEAPPSSIQGQEIRTSFSEPRTTISMAEDGKSEKRERPRRRVWWMAGLLTAVLISAMMILALFFAFSG